MSPPAKTPFLLVLPVSWSARMFPHLFVSSPGVVAGTRGLAPLPIDMTTVSTARRNSEPLTGTGRLRPDASGSPSSIFWHSISVTHASSFPRKRTGLVRRWNSIPSSSAWWISSIRAGISFFDRRYTT